MPNDVLLHHATLCDEIRREDSGKYFILGIYSGQVFPTEFPASLLISYWVPAVFNAPNTVIQFEVWTTTLEGGKEQKSIGVEISVDTNDKGIGLEDGLSLGKFPVKINEPSKLTLKGRQKGGRWKTLSTKSVLLSDE